MKRISGLLALSFIGLLASSCGVGTAIVLNQNQSNTQVLLNSANYKVVDKVSGSAEVEYVFLIGGIRKKQLYNNAYSAMVEKANLVGSPKALTNIVTEEHVGGFAPFFIRRTITVSAHVIEFEK